MTRSSPYKPSSGGEKAAGSHQSANSQSHALSQESVDVLRSRQKTKKPPVTHVPVQIDTEEPGNREELLSAFMIDPKYLRKPRKQASAPAPEPVRFHNAISVPFMADRIRRPRLQVPVIDRITETDEHEDAGNTRRKIIGAAAAAGLAVAAAFSRVWEWLAGAVQSVTSRLPVSGYSNAAGASHSVLGRHRVGAVLPIALVATALTFGITAGILMNSGSSNETGAPGVVTGDADAPDGSGVRAGVGPNSKSKSGTNKKGQASGTSSAAQQGGSATGAAVQGAPAPATTGTGGMGGMVGTGAPSQGGTVVGPQPTTPVQLPATPSPQPVVPATPPIGGSGGTPPAPAPQLPSTPLAPLQSTVDSTKNTLNGAL